MFSSWKIGKAFGIDLYLHWTFWLMPAFVFLESYREVGGDEATLMVSVVFALFGCILLHELGHALAARRFGIGTRDITLYPIGGVARLLGMSERPWQEIVIALAGPAVNVVIATGLGLGLYLCGRSLEPMLDTTEPYGEAFLNRLMWLNVGLVVFNMIPAFPMDGGRVFRATLALVMSRVRATEAAVVVGALLSGLFILVGFVGFPPEWKAMPMMAVLGGFIFLIGQQELAMVRYLAEIQQPAPEPGGPVVLVPIEQVIDESCRPADPNFTGFTYNPRTRLWIEWRDGQPVSASGTLGD